MEPSLGLFQAEVAECSNSNKRLSKDSGTGSDTEQGAWCVCVCVCVCVQVVMYVRMYDQSG